MSPPCRPYALQGATLCVNVMLDTPMIMFTVGLQQSWTLLVLDQVILFLC